MPPNMLSPGEAELAQANSYYPQEPADLTGGLPINLDSLRDGPPGSKPFYPYSTLIRCVDTCVWLILAFNAILDMQSRARLTKSYSWKTSTMLLNLVCVSLWHLSSRFP